jgi:hypothetical protein
MTKELTKMHDMNVFCPIKRDSLTKEERAKVLALLMFLKEKRDKTGGWTKAEGQLDEARIDLVNGSNGIGVHHGCCGCSQRERFGML